MVIVVVSFYIFSEVGCVALYTSLVKMASLVFGTGKGPFKRLLVIMFDLLCKVVSCAFSCCKRVVACLKVAVPVTVFTLVS